MKVIIAGSRDFDDYALLREKCDFFLSGVQVESVICGECRGADLLGKAYAKDRGIPVESFPAKWKVFGKSAGMRRNKEMAAAGDALIAFWDGKSSGTKNMIDCMKDKPVRIVRTDWQKGADNV